jgi:hypothetical protein
MEVHTREVYAHEVHAYEMYACKMYAYKIHGYLRYTPVRCTRMGCTRMRCTPVRYTLMRYDGEKVWIEPIYVRIQLRQRPLIHATSRVCYLGTISPQFVPLDTNRYFTGSTNRNSCAQYLRELLVTDPRVERIRILGSKDDLLDGSCAWVLDDRLVE